MKNKKGFTLTELLAVLAIIGIIIAIAVPSFSTLLKKNKQEYYDKLDKTVLTTVKTYYKDNSKERPKDLLNASIVQYTALTTQKYIDSISVYNSSTSCTGYGIIVKTAEGYSYANCMKCGDEGDGYQNYISITETNQGSASNEDKLCDAAWKDNTTNITTSFNIPEHIYGYVNPNYQNNKGNAETLQNSLCVKETVIKKNAQGIELQKTYNDANKTCPTDITNINPKIVGDYKVVYSVGTEKEDSTITFFQHEAPTVTGADKKILKGNTINLSVSDENKKTFLDYKDANGNVVSQIKSFEYSTDGKNWSTACVTSSEVYQCNFVINKSYNNIKFRVVGTGSDNSNHYGKESAGYDISMKYYVTLDPDGGTLTGSNIINGNQIEASKGENYDLPTPTKLGYDFVEWKDDKGNAYKNGDEVKADDEHTLKATWKAKSYVVTFDPNGGTITTDNKNVTYNENYGDLPTATKTGNTFLGWTTTKDDSSTLVTKDSKMTTAGDHTVYALWRPNVLTIKYWSNYATSGTCTNGCAEKGSVTGISATVNKVVLTQTRDYDETFNLANYNNSSYLSLTRSGFSRTGYWTNAYETQKVGQDVDKTASEFASIFAGEDLSKGDVTIDIYAQWTGTVQTVTSTSCTTTTLSAGVYYIEIVGGGAGGHGRNGHNGGDGARWAGYVELPGGSAKICPGIGSAGTHGLSSAPSNGGNSYISIDSKNVVVASGGKNYTTTYSNATNSIGNGATVKKQCYNVKGRKGNYTPYISGTRYGAGGYYEIFGTYKDAYDGTAGIVKLQYIKTSEQWANNPITICPTTLCSNTNCGWTGW